MSNDRHSGYVSRTDLERFIGWTVAAIGGDILIEGELPDRLRLCLRSPEGVLRDVYVEVSDEGDGLVFHHSARDCLAYASSGSF